MHGGDIQTSTTHDTYCKCNIHLECGVYIECDIHYECDIYDEYYIYVECSISVVEPTGDSSPGRNTV